MKTFALTGGVGMGKSAAADVLRARGVPVMDTDELAHKLVEPGEPALQEIEKTFGKETVGPDGRLRRDRVADMVFADAAARAKLEAILHPRITSLWREQIQTWQKEGKSLVAVVIPLLFETGAETEFDAIICVACSTTTQQQRLLERGWTPRDIELRNAAQLSIEQKIARSHFVIWNEGDLEVLAEQLSRVISLD
jgi:dephospho-CoA kinase